ncbi:MAG: hypothetical protein JOY55_14125 [Mycobacterium sp.]|nr:hypothetical protein [Mycobacterium sp.]
MTTPTAPPCWPNDPDYLDGKTEIELPSERFTKVFWDTDILDLDDKNKEDTIIGNEELFKVRFRVELKGRLWRCITGDWLFNVGFTLIGREKSFYLTDLLPGDPNFYYRGWRGCDTLCIERCVSVPPGTIKLDEDTEVYETAAKVELRCCDGHLAVAGYEALEEYQFFKGA